MELKDFIKTSILSIIEVIGELKDLPNVDTASKLSGEPVAKGNYSGDEIYLKEIGAFCVM